MTTRGAGGLLLALAVVGLAGCGSGAERGKRSVMDRCRGGRAMTVTDPTGDNLNRRYPGTDKERAAAAKPGAFDIKRVTIATTNTTLCASVTFAQGNPGLQPGGGPTLRPITLELAPANPRRRDKHLPARLQWEFTLRLADWITEGNFQNDDPDADVAGERVSGVQKRTVQLSVPVRELVDIAARPTNRSPVINLDPRAFSWRLSVTSDCAPGPRRVIVFPSARTIALPSGEESDLSGSCR